MRFPTGCRLFVLAALVMVAALDLAPDAEAKGKKAACKGKTVAVKIGKRKTCQSFAKMFPQPKAIDVRLAYLEQALRFDPAKVTPLRKRKGAKGPRSGVDAAGKRAQKKLLKLAPKLLAFVDRKGGAHSSSFPPGPALASAGCQPGPAGPTGSTGGATMGAFGDNGGYVDAPIGGGLRVKVTFVSCGGVASFNLPECPTANGSVDGRGSGEFRATFEIRDGDQVLTRNSSVFEEKAKVHGEVGADAKLKFIDVEHTQEAFIVAAVSGYYPVVIRGGVTRKVRIDMPDGKFDPDEASVVFFGDPISSDSGAKSFASTAESAIRGYRSVEGRWTDFSRQPFCAEATFTPPSNTLKLKRDDQKQLGIYAKAKQDGGHATGAKWTLLNQENAEFTPPSSEDASPSISYRVTNAPPGGLVKVKVKFTSTAGVGEKTWFQPTEQTGVNHIEGTFGGKLENETPLEIPMRHVWSGFVKLDRLGPSEGGSSGIYQVSSGNVSIDTSGIEPSGITGCHGSGHGQATLGPSSGSMFVQATGPEGTPPYTYLVSLTLPLLEYDVTRSDCPEAAQKAGYEGSTFKWGAAWSLHQEGKESADGLTFLGTEKLSFGSVTQEETWTLHGVE